MISALQLSSTNQVVVSSAAFMASIYESSRGCCVGPKVGTFIADRFKWIAAICAIMNPFMIRKLNRQLALKAHRPFFMKKLPTNQQN